MCVTLSVAVAVAVLLNDTKLDEVVQVRPAFGTRVKLSKLSKVRALAQNDDTASTSATAVGDGMANEVKAENTRAPAGRQRNLAQRNTATGAREARPQAQAPRTEAIVRRAHNRPVQTGNNGSVGKRVLSFLIACAILHWSGALGWFIGLGVPLDTSSSRDDTLGNTIGNTDSVSASAFAGSGSPSSGGSYANTKDAEFGRDAVVNMKSPGASHWDGERIKTGGDLKLDMNEDKSANTNYANIRNDANVNMNAGAKHYSGVGMKTGRDFNLNM